MPPLTMAQMVTMVDWAVGTSTSGVRAEAYGGGRLTVAGTGWPPGQGGKGPFTGLTGQGSMEPQGGPALASERSGAGRGAARQAASRRAAVLFSTAGVLTLRPIYSERERELEYCVFFKEPWHVFQAAAVTWSEMETHSSG
ncbi:hypothetical protein SKAU_G00108380 [Synaphobranchus kaupii]|uniref:Uncharacterized protein n=1 Tax=Synaphobranchus kaupii TaxID=118154 RepID=A0A9Q1G0R8_SYNKA|nr:hypothetical protein SKAU_G00108380 [Synaphobranchus kaupii]